MQGGRERRAAPQRNRAERQRGEHRQSARIGDGDAIQPDLAEPRERRGTVGDEQAHGAPRQRKPNRAARNREQRALREEIACDAEAASSERATDGDLPLSRIRANEEQIGDVRAGDQQDEPDGRKQNPESACDASDGRILQGSRV